MARFSFYGGTYIPRANMDGGSQFAPTSTGALNSAYASAMAVPCYVELLLEGTAQPDLMSGELNVTIIAEQEPGTTPYMLYASANSKYVPYGSGLFSEFHYIIRKIYPNYNGTVINFSGNYPETLYVDIPFTFSSTWWHFDPSDIYFAVWLQSTSGTKQVHQSAHIDITSFNAVEELPSPVTHSDVFRLGNPYPNPFSTTAYIPLFVENSAVLSVKIFDLTGREVRTLSSGTVISENSVFNWDGRDDQGTEMNAGIYRVELTGEGVQDSKTIIKIR
ncbi:MAG: FlgD immunoglobulin-like domain containing protein [bacterium]